uniref:Uncharacterized protein n=1 Tax=Myripristis murdjan TaxID=586833 RepID=A0A667W7S4_9TELE
FVHLCFFCDCIVLLLHCVSHDSGASFTKAPAPDYASTPLQHFRQPLSQPEDNLQYVPWPEQSPPLYPYQSDEPFPPPPPPVSDPLPVGAAGPNSVQWMPAQQYPQPPFTTY